MIGASVVSRVVVSIMYSTVRVLCWRDGLSCGFLYGSLRSYGLLGLVSLMVVNSWVVLRWIVWRLDGIGLRGIVGIVMVHVVLVVCGGLSYVGDGRRGSFCVLVGVFIGRVCVGWYDR